MPHRAWSERRERQYGHITAGFRQQGWSEGAAEEIAARIVNKERARAGEARSRMSKAQLERLLARR